MKQKEEEKGGNHTYGREQFRERDQVQKGEYAFDRGTAERNCFPDL